MKGKEPQARNKRSASNSSNSSTKSNKKLKTSSPMEMLIEAASMLNPRQFELPYYMHEPCNFPGTDKSTYIKDT